MTAEELWGWWFAKAGAPQRALTSYDKAVASRIVREASLTSSQDADDFYDWLSSWYRGVDLPAMLRYVDRWAAYRATQSPSTRFIRKHGDRW